MGSDELNGGKFLPGPACDVLLPIGGTRTKRPVPGGIGNPQERRTVGVSKRCFVSGNAKWPVSVEWITALIGGADERAALPMQAGIGGIAARAAPCPVAYFTRPETETPGTGTVPEPLDGVRLIAGRGKLDDQRSVEQWMGIVAGAGNGMVKYAPPMHRCRWALTQC